MTKTVHVDADRVRAAHRSWRKLAKSDDGLGAEVKRQEAETKRERKRRDDEHADSTAEDADR